MEITFEGKNILVTGAGEGIGKEIVIALVRNNANVYAISRTQSKLDTLKTEYPSVKTYTVDLSNWNETRQIVESLPPMHGLVNNAGIAILEEFTKVTPEAFDALFNVNLKAVINVSQVVVKSMIEHRISGSIVNISSQAAKIALFEHACYCASKAALDSVTRSMAQELGTYNIRTNSVNPTVVLTTMGKKVWSDPRKSEPLLNRIPLRRFAECEDVANAVLFLLSSQSGMINGSTIPLEGGLLSC